MADTSHDLSRDKSAPAPLSSSDCDLRGLEWMPLDTVNLLDSDLFLQSTGDEFKAAMALICKSWRQVPAGSLPRDERSLAILSAAHDWTSVRTMALRNWVLCSDGRLYHPIVAAKAMEALPHRQEFVEKKTADSERKERERKDRKAMFQTLREAGIVLHYSAKTKELREAIAGLNKPPAPSAPSPLVTPRSNDMSRDLSHDLSRLGQGHHTTPQVLNTELLSGGAAPPPVATPAPSPTPGPAPATNAPALVKPAKAAKAAKEPTDPAPSAAVWEAYATAYRRKYGVDPLRNAHVNGMLANFVSRIPKDDAPHVAAFYLGLSGYSSANHSVKLLVRDAEGLHTRWATNNRDAANASTARTSRAAEFIRPSGRPGRAPDDGRTIDMEANDAIALASR